MSYFIIIRGPAGIGKTTIARKLANLLDAEYISVDDILREQQLDVVEGECIPLSNFLKANDIAVSIAKPLLSNSRKVVIDGNFYHKEQVLALIRDLGFQNYVFDLKATVDECIKRDSDRVKPLGALSIRAVHSLVSRFNYGTRIDTAKKSEGDVIKEILQHLPI